MSSKELPSVTRGEVTTVYYQRVLVPFSAGIVCYCVLYAVHVFAFYQVVSLEVVIRDADHWGEERITF